MVLFVLGTVDADPESLEIVLKQLSIYTVPLIDYNVKVDYIFELIPMRFDRPQKGPNKTFGTFPFLHSNDNNLNSLANLHQIFKVLILKILIENRF